MVDLPSTALVDLADRLDIVFGHGSRDPGAHSLEVDLTTYFGDRADNRYAGRYFTTLAGGGDRPAAADRITADDLIAVEMLSVRVPPLVAQRLLDGDLGRQLSRLLHDIPTDVSILDDTAAGHLGDDRPASRAWHLLIGLRGINWVTAGKLLARKRPALIPVYDRVVACALASPDDFWMSLHVAMRADRSRWTARLARLRERASVPTVVPDLRIVDVGVWMYHVGTHVNDGVCPSIVPRPQPRS